MKKKKKKRRNYKTKKKKKKPTQEGLQTETKPSVGLHQRPREDGVVRPVHAISPRVLPHPHILPSVQVCGDQHTALVIAVPPPVPPHPPQHLPVLVYGRQDAAAAVVGHHPEEEEVHSSHGGREDAGGGAVAVTDVGDDVVEMEDGVAADVGDWAAAELHGERHW